MTTAIQPCLKIDCCPPNDLAYSIVNGQVYSNPESSFVFECPPGFVCDPGVYPKTIIIPQSPWQPPPHDPSKPQILSMPCCSGWIVETLPAGSTQAEYDAAIAAMLAAFAQAEADCKDAQQPNRPWQGIAWNDQQSTSCLPEEGTLIVHDPNFPYNIYYDGVGLVMPPHVFSAATATNPNAKAAANAAAFAALTQVWNAAMASGQIECGAYITEWTYFNESNPTCSEALTTHSEGGLAGSILVNSCYLCEWDPDLLAWLAENTVDYKRFSVKITALADIHLKLDYSMTAQKGSTAPYQGKTYVILVNGLVVTDPQLDSVGTNWTTASYSSTKTGTVNVDILAGTSQYYTLIITGESLAYDAGGCPTPGSCGPNSGSMTLTITPLP